MSNKKLAQEIERTVKKVNEGVELFDELLDKVYSAPNASQRDKFEGELKKEIKKLQRLREQVRAWIGGSEVKDKAELIEKRKVIESRMEKFKICEQKTKMKAYSKEALSQKQVQRRKKSKVIPETEEKKEAKTWIRDCQESIQTQIDEIEAEIEEEQKARKPDNDQINQLKNRIRLHQKYIEKLDTIYTFLEDDQLKAIDIQEIKETVEYYIDENGEPDFIDDEETFENLYKKAEEAEQYDNFEDIEDEVVMDGNVIQAIPVDGEPVVTINKNESEVLKAIEEEALRVKEKQEKERLEREQREREEAEKERLEKERLEKEKLEKAKKQDATKQKPPVPQVTKSQTGSKAQPTKAAVTQPVATKQPKTPTKTATKQAVVPKKIQVPTPELNFSSIITGSPTKSNTPVSATGKATQPTVTKQPKLPSQSTSAVKSNISYIDVINQGTQPPPPVNVIANTVTNKTTTPRGRQADQQTATPTYDPIPFIKSEMSDITIQTSNPPQPVVKSVLSNKDKKMQPNTPSSANAGPIGQSLHNLYTENDMSNDETFGSISSTGGMLGSLEDLANRTQEAHQGFQMNMQPSHPQLGSGVLGMGSAASISPTSNLTISSGNQLSQTGVHMDNSIQGMMGSIGGVTSPISSVPFAPSPSPLQSTSPTLQNKGEYMDAKSQMLQTSLNFIPSALDCERPRQSAPMNPFDTPSFFPQEQLPILKETAVFSEMEPDTLFFIFYFQQGTYQQYLAAKALKKLAWRYHKKYQTWFQRHDQPKHTTNEYELGTYVYFDFEQDWCQRIKGGFRFEYEFLEETL